MQALHVPAGLNELKGQVIQQVLVQWPGRPQAKIADRLNQWSSEMPQPDVVDSHPGGQGMIAVRQPVRQRRSSTAAGLWVATARRQGIFIGGLDKRHLAGIQGFVVREPSSLEICFQVLDRRRGLGSFFRIEQVNSCPGQVHSNQQAAGISRRTFPPLPVGSIVCADSRF